MKNKKTSRLLLHVTLEILIYAALLIVYFAAVLRFLGEPLNRLFHLSPGVYGIATLILIVVQAVFLEAVTTFLLKLLRLDAPE